MRYLVVPDIHERPDKLEHIRPLIKEADKVYFLGDWFDSFNMKSDTKGTVQFLNEFMADDKCESCLGNHECHYFFRHPHFRCSGYRPQTQVLVDLLVPEAILHKFKLFHRVGDLILSHAGYHPKYLPIEGVDGGTRYHPPDELTAGIAVANAFDGHFDRLFNPGESSGGSGVGGPTWLRWPADGPKDGIFRTVDRFEPLNFPQIVGHTPDRAQTIREAVSDGGVSSFCIDTGFKDVVWIDDDGKIIKVVDLRPEGD